jgi:hypothetical protein
LFSSLASEYKARVELTSRGKHSSLSHYGIEYCLEKLHSTANLEGAHPKDSTLRTGLSSPAYKKQAKVEVASKGKHSSLLRRELITDLKGFVV